MKRYVIRLALLVIFGSFFIACSSGKNQVTGKKIEIKYMGTAKPGDWIQVDEIKLTHKGTDTVALSLKDTLYTQKNPMDYFYDNAETCMCLPASLLFEQIRDKWFGVPVSNPYMSYHFVKIFNINSQIVDKADYYEFENKPGFMINGIVRILNTEGSDIRVRTSPNYPALITIVE
ncbi:MAG: hypothetical protein RIM99_05875 [Cyclobacteriaceae bacterium]